MHIKKLKVYLATTFQLYLVMPFNIVILKILIQSNIQTNPRFTTFVCRLESENSG